MFIFIEKYQKKYLRSTRKYPANLHEKNSWCWLEKSCDTEKVLSLVLLSWRTLTIVWVSFCHQNPWDNKKIKYFFQENFKKSLCFTPAHGSYGNLISHFMHTKWIPQNDVNVWREFYNDDNIFFYIFMIVSATYGTGTGMYVSNFLAEGFHFFNLIGF